MGTPLEYPQASAQQPKQDGLLNMQAIFRLLENDRPRRIDDRRGDFIATMRRQESHEDRVVSGVLEQALVDLIRSEHLSALGCLVLLTHAGPHVGVDGLRAANRR